MTLLLILGTIGGLYTLALVATLAVAGRAPEGYESAEGFHLGRRGS